MTCRESEHHWEADSVRAERLPPRGCHYPMVRQFHAMEQPTRFQKLVLEAKQRITEIAPGDARAEVEKGSAILVDVREDEDWQQGHAAGAMHLRRGIIELEIEEQIPEISQRIICYCGGGSRAALVADSLQKMGYTNVRSLSGGLKAWKAMGLPTER